MMKWCIIDKRKSGDMFLNARESKEDALNIADYLWSVMADADKKTQSHTLLDFAM